MMSDLRIPFDENARAGMSTFVPTLSLSASPTKASRRIFAITALSAAAIVLSVVTGFFIYYRSFRDTPQYSLALLIDAARRDDRSAIDEFVNIDAIADDFVPQITDKAIEFYGRGVAPSVIEKARHLARPIMPAVKERARAELPRVIRERTERFAYVPFAAMVLGAERYLDIRVEGETALVRSRLREHNFEVRMRRQGERWEIVGVREEQLAGNIARAIGQQIMAIAAYGLTRETADRLGVGNIADLIRQAEELVR